MKLPIKGKEECSEKEIRELYINPTLEKSGWVKDEGYIEEYPITQGRVIFEGSMHTRQTPLRADYVLLDRSNYNIAVLEAKKNNKVDGVGLQQAIKYAKMLDVKLAYSTNGNNFREHNFITGKERDIDFDKFPSLEEMRQLVSSDEVLTEKQQQIINTTYYSDRFTHKPRYYQQIAINRTIEAIAKGQQRVLLVMATGTGKTYTAFQIIHRLHSSRTTKKILYLADRNILIDQTMVQDFKPFKKIMTKVQGSTMDPAYEIYMALYHQLVGKEGERDPFTQVGENFFDLIIVDECHRGSRKDDSAWRKVLEYFSSATQIGMTATPVRKNEGDNIEYFGEPIYTYSLKQGILDGFLAPYRVTNSYINLDLSGYKPRKGEEDIYKRAITQREYNRRDFGTNIAFLLRREIVAKRITEMLHTIGRMTKTIVFCSDTQEAEEMRKLLVNLNSDECRKDPRYVMCITYADNEGKKQLDNFIDANEKYPTVVTTSELLATGVDCKTCGLIVIDKEINSITEFKQIIGRGTRLYPEKGKWHLEILDFRNATSKFRDPDFDGLPEAPKHKTGEGGGGGDKPTEPKFIVAGKKIEIISEQVSVLGEDGSTMRTESLIDFTRKQIRKRYPNLSDFIKNWGEADRKQAILDELKDYFVLIEAVKEANPSLSQADYFDIICHVAYDQKPLTRRERANNVKKRNYFAKYEGKAREVLETLLDKYADYGIVNIEDTKILETKPFDKLGKPQRIIKDLFVNTENYKKAFDELESEIYKQEA